MEAPRHIFCSKCSLLVGNYEDNSEHRCAQKVINFHYVCDQCRIVMTKYSGYRFNDFIFCSKECASKFKRKLSFDLIPHIIYETTHANKIKRLLYYKMLITTLKVFNKITKEICEMQDIIPIIINQLAEIFRIDLSKMKNVQNYSIVLLKIDKNYTWININNTLCPISIYSKLIFDYL